MPDTIPNELFCYEMKRLHWTDRQVAAKILELLNIKDEEVRKKQAQTDEDRVKRWRRGVATPSTYFQGLLEKLFGKKIKKLGWPPNKNEIPNWHLDAKPSLFFTGREDVLIWLHKGIARRDTGEPLKVQALTGLSGIGKSQTAIQYAHRFKHEYHTIMWLRAENSLVLAEDFANITSVVDLPEKDEKDQKMQIDAVIRWLGDDSITRWLLIFDSADDPELIQEILEKYIPEPCHGHVIITTRSGAIGEIEQYKEVDSLSLENSTDFLFKRVKKISRSKKNTAFAEEIAKELGGLPLALEQAGAYIEEKPGCGFTNYLNLYHKEAAKRQKLLAFKGEHTRYRRDPIAITLSLAFDQVYQVNPSAVALLALFAFFAPDQIPKEFVKVGLLSSRSRDLQALAEHDNLFYNATGELYKFSLIRDDPNADTFSTHRLVQTCVKDTMDEETQSRLAEQAIDAINESLAGLEHYNIAISSRRYLQHLKECVDHIKQREISSPEAAALLHNTAIYLTDRSQFAEAEPLLQRALAILEMQYEPNHPITASSFNALAQVYVSQGKYEQAEELIQRALAILEMQYEPNHPSPIPAISLSTLASIYTAQGKYEQAEELMQRALAILERQYGSSNPHIATCLYNFAILYRVQGKHPEAEPLLRRALAIFERQLGLFHPKSFDCLDELLFVYVRQEKYRMAMELMQRALTIYEQQLGHEDNPLKSYLQAYYDSISQKMSEIEANIPMKKIHYTWSQLTRALAAGENVLGLKWTAHGDGSGWNTRFIGDRGEVLVAVFIKVPFQNIFPGVTEGNKPLKELDIYYYPKEGEGWNSMALAEVESISRGMTPNSLYIQGIFTHPGLTIMDKVPITVKIHHGEKTESEVFIDVMGGEAEGSLRVSLLYPI
jgi:tetratricopeptide (TPR) repeat protein